MSEVISSGPFAKVELGVKELDGRLRAVIYKTATEQGQALIENEGRILAKLEHQGLVQLIGRTTTDNGRAQLVLKYIEGIPLSHWIANPNFNSFRDTLALQIGTDVARVLAYLHQGHEISDSDFGMVVHGDLTPANLLVGTDGTIRLIDFGTAAIEHRSGKSLLPAKAATLRYTSPDRANYERVSARDDIFALGLILWELGTGRRYWGDKENSEILARLADFEPLDPATVRPDISPALRNIIIRCLVAEGFTGYTDASDLLSDLQAAQAQTAQVNLADLTRNFPEMLATFRKRRDALAQASSKTETSQNESGLLSRLTKFIKG